MFTKHICFLIALELIYPVKLELTNITNLYDMADDLFQSESLNDTKSKRNHWTAGLECGEEGLIVETIMSINRAISAGADMSQTFIKLEFCNEIGLDSDPECNWDYLEELCNTGDRNCTQYEQDLESLFKPEFDEELMRRAYGFTQEYFHWIQKVFLGWQRSTNPIGEDVLLTGLNLFGIRIKEILDDLSYLMDTCGFKEDLNQTIRLGKDIYSDNTDPISRGFHDSLRFRQIQKGLKTLLESFQFIMDNDLQQNIDAMY